MSQHFICGREGHKKLADACRMEIITPTDYVGPLMELAQARRGDFKDMTYLTETRTTLVYDMPLAEVRHSQGFPSSITLKHAFLCSNAKFPGKFAQAS